MSTKTAAIVERAAWTFIQAFLAVFLAGLTTHLTNVQIKALTVAAFAAALSAIKSTAFTPPEA